jgi:hypothetical protein
MWWNKGYIRTHGVLRDYVLLNALGIRLLEWEVTTQTFTRSTGGKLYDSVRLRTPRKMPSYDIGSHITDSLPF